MRGIEAWDFSGGSSCSALVLQPAGYKVTIYLLPLEQDLQCPGLVKSKE